MKKTFQTGKTVIFVLSGGISRNKKGQWQSSQFGQKALVGPSGSYARVVAAALLWQKNPRWQIVVSGGRGEADSLLPDGFSISKIMKRELLALKVPSSMIIEDELSNNTHQQLFALADLFKKHNWSAVKIVSNRYHLPRIRAMIESVGQLGLLRMVVDYVSAEDILLKKAPDKWRGLIEKAYHSQEFKNLETAEKNGIKQIKNETYHYR